MIRRGGASAKTKCKCDGVACAIIRAKAMHVKSFFEVRCNLVQRRWSPAPVYMLRSAMSSIFAGLSQIISQCVSLR